jgi:ligand-binding SRPBCC domain-containing protein
MVGMPAVHSFEREQMIRTDLDAAWQFISSPANLDAITPPDLAFSIVSPVPREMHDGLLVEYRIRIPWVGRQTWLTEIKHIREGESFVDEQRIGPYRLWYHYHHIEPHPEGVRFYDRVTYALPYGPLGALAHALFVRRTLRRIFDFREKRLQELLAS